MKKFKLKVLTNYQGLRLANNWPINSVGIISILVVTNIARMSQCKSVSPLFKTFTGLIISDSSIFQPIINQENQTWINVANPDRNFVNISNIFFGIFKSFKCVHFKTCKNSNPSCRLSKDFVLLITLDQSECELYEPIRKPFLVSAI